jgi:hypothetical protein
MAVAHADLKLPTTEDPSTKFNSNIPQPVINRLALLDNLVSEVKLKLLVIAEDMQGKRVIVHTQY